MCDIEHRVIGLHFFENHLNGYLNPDTFKNLVHLKYLNIFNDGRVYEMEELPHKNTIWILDSTVFSSLSNLEEINMNNLDMLGKIDAEFVSALPNLKYLNLAHNQLSGELPNTELWAGMKKLSYI